MTVVYNGPIATGNIIGTSNITGTRLTFSSTNGIFSKPKKPPKIYKLCAILNGQKFLLRWERRPNTLRPSYNVHASDRLVGYVGKDYDGSWFALNTYSPNTYKGFATRRHASIKLLEIERIPYEVK